MKLIVFCFLFIAITYAQKLETNKTSALCDKYSCKYNYLCYKSGSIIKTLFHCCTYLKCKKGIIRATIVGKSKKCGCCRDPFNGPYGMIKNGGYGVRKNRWRYFCCDGKLVLNFIKKTTLSSTSRPTTTSRSTAIVPKG
uniref:Uncharacterized protein n=1 Tax=Lepeophtheirus salmonis TaxID=72036 RepID=A0A0K2UD07_LEPSM